jgi:hypothetical protein
MKLEQYPFALPCSGKKTDETAAAAQRNRSHCLLISFCGILSPVCRPNGRAAMPSLWRRESVLPTRRFRRNVASTISPAAGNREQDLRKIKGNQFFWQTSYIDPLQAPLLRVAGYLGYGVMSALSNQTSGSKQRPRVVRADLTRYFVLSPCKASAKSD